MGVVLNFSRGDLINKKETILQDIKNAMRARDKERLSVLRMLTAALKQIEVDNRVELTDDKVIAEICRMIKQREDSLAQYKSADRTDLADKEAFEISVLQAYLPQKLSAAEIEKLINDTIASVGANSMQDMGKVMNTLRPQVLGKADLADVSKKVKELLG